MPRKKVTRLRKSCGSLAGHSQRQAKRVAGAALALVRDLMPDGLEELTLEQFQLALGWLLLRLRARLTAIDNEHAHELQVDRNHREDRDSAAREGRERMFLLRDSLDGLFGAGGGAKIFEDEPRVPDDPTALHQLMGHVIDNLTNPLFEMPRPLLKGVKLDREESVDDLEDPYLRLDEALSALDGTESDSKHSQSEKDLSVEETAKLVGKVYRFYEAFYDLVGFEKLAGRLRRSSHRRVDGGEVEEPGIEPEASEDAAEAEETEEAPVATVAQLPQVA